MARDHAPSATRGRQHPEEEGWFRILADAASEALVIHEDATVLEVNRAFLDLFGYDREEALGRTLYEFAATASHPLLRAALREGREAPWDIVGLRHDGSTFDVEVTARGAPLPGSSTRVAALRDVTARRREEEHMRTLERAVESATNGIIIAGPIEDDNPILYVNPAFERMSGYERDEMIGVNCRFMQGPETDPEAPRQMRRAIERGEETKVRILNYRKDGTTFWNEIHLAPVRDGDGRAGHYVGIMHDVTRRMRDEEEIRALNQTLEERVRRRTADLQASYRDLESFSHSVSHDLRAPLRSIAFYSELLLDEHGQKLEGEAKRYVEGIRSEAEHVSALMQALLVLSRSTRGEMQRERVDLSRLARDVGGELRRAMPNPRVELVVEPGLLVEGDPRLLRVVLENLLANAWKFSAGVENPRVEFGSEGGAEGRVYYVRDNGLGFSMEEANRLFTPFQRLKGARDYEGTGIGLATVQRIIQRHEGRVWAKGEPGRGATFYFTL